MRIGVLGAGGVGATIGGFLARSGAKVVLIDTDGEHVAAINEHGLKLDDGPGGDPVIIAVAAVCDARGQTPVDVMVVLTKTFQTREAVRGVQPMIDKKSWIVTLQNGLQNDAAIRDALPGARVAAGTTTVGGEKLAPGQVRVAQSTWAGRSLTEVALPAETADTHPELQKLTEMLSAAGLPAQCREDGQATIWAKACIAASMAPLTALLSIRIGPVLEHEPTRRVMRRLFDETVDVAASAGVELEREVLWSKALEVYGAADRHLTSMAADVLAQRPTENEALSAAVARIAREHGITAPLTDVVSLLMAAREATYGDIVGTDKL